MSKFKVVDRKKWLSNLLDLHTHWDGSVGHGWETDVLKAFEDVRNEALEEAAQDMERRFASRIILGRFVDGVWITDKESKSDVGASIRALKSGEK